jgi:chemotaxis protein MotB
MLYFKADEFINPQKEEREMKLATTIVSALLVAVLGAGGYLYVGQYQPVKNDYQQTKTKKAELERRVSDLSQELNLKVAEIAKTKREKEDEIAQVQSTKDSLISKMQNEINKNQIQITQLADKLKVSIVDKILFPSGEADITDEGLEVLGRVGNVLKNMEDKIIRVEGHTDNVPIRGRLARKFPTNWELSTARATNIVRLLQERVNIDPTKLEAVGLGEYQPVASNDTNEGKAQNRRIEIALLPIK